MQRNTTPEEQILSFSPIQFSRKKEGKLLLSVALFNQDGEEEEKLLFFGKMELETGSIKIRGNQVLPSRNLDRLFAPYLSMGGGKRKKLKNSFSLFHSVKYAKRRVGRRREQKEKKKLEQ